MDSFLSEARSLTKVFLFKGKIVSVAPYGNGHINKTYLVVADERYILQRLNPEVFLHSKETMGNLIAVTTYLSEAIKHEQKRGHVVKQEPLSLVKTLKGELSYADDKGAYWRAFHLREDSETFEEPLTIADLSSSGEAFGEFLYLLRDYPSETLYETIPHFHDTPARYAHFLDAVKANPKKRNAECAKEIAYLERFASFYPTLVNALARSEIPYRVTHNDTKFNNLLFDAPSHEVVSVLDLDTVMKGTPLYDYGDACRSSCNEAEENERDLRKVSFSLAKFRAFSQGYLAGSHEILNARERDLLAPSVFLLTLELALRFLEDYLRGDIYFAIQEKDDNLVRARGQITLAQDIEKKKDAMDEIIREVSSR
jgi:Ser/Thr protein kinase RdoA (MazF antagonist)